ncbi:MAG: hypothetical protein GY842_05175 [bacterium]|nr:hypothetical protein [bacterium]
MITPQQENSVQSSELISGQSVLFTLRDAVCPDPAEIIRATGPDLQVTGSIVFFSDGGDQKKRFAVVEVTGIHTPLIVPVEYLDAATRISCEEASDSVENPSRRAC